MGEEGLWSTMTSGSLLCSILSCSWCSRAKPAAISLGTRSVSCNTHTHNLVCLHAFYDLIPNLLTATCKGQGRHSERGCRLQRRIRWRALRCWRTPLGGFRPAVDSNTGAAACSPTPWRPGSEPWRGTGCPRCSPGLVHPAAPWQEAEDGGRPAGQTQIARLHRWTAGWSNCCDIKK